MGYIQHKKVIIKVNFFIIKDNFQILSNTDMESKISLTEITIKVII